MHCDELIIREAVQHIDLKTIHFGGKIKILLLGLYTFTFPYSSYMHIVTVPARKFLKRRMAGEDSLIFIKESVPEDLNMFLGNASFVIIFASYVSNEHDLKVCICNIK